jgi:hypothetical protein
MIFSTRNSAEALNLVNTLPLEDFEKGQIVAHFGTMTALMEEMKESKSLNSKGGERWFMQRLVEKVSQAQTQVGTLLAGLEGEELNRAMFLASQNSASLAVLELAQECKASPAVISGLEEYCELMNSLAKKYSGFDRKEQEEDL